MRGFSDSYRYASYSEFVEKTSIQEISSEIIVLLAVQSRDIPSKATLIVRCTHGYALDYGWGTTNLLHAHLWIVANLQRAHTVWLAGIETDCRIEWNGNGERLTVDAIGVTPGIFERVPHR